MQAHATVTVSEVEDLGSATKTKRSVVVTLDGEYGLVKEIVNHLEELKHRPNMQVW
jgi:hypothetical protein